MSRVTSSTSTSHRPGVPAMQQGGAMPATSKRNYKKALELAKNAAPLLKGSSTSSADREQGIALLTEAITLAPDKAAFYSLRGKAFAHAGMFQRALFDYSMTIRLEPTAAKHYGCRAECFKKLGRVADCLKDHTEAVRHEKGGGRYIFERAMIYFEVGDYSAAAQDITTALSKECANPFRAYLCRGICHRHNKDIDQSVDDLNKAIELNSADTDAHDHLGLSLLLSRDYKGALGAFTKAVVGCTTPAEDDRKARYLNHRGLVQHQLKEYDKALEDYTASLRLNPHEDNTYFNRGNTYCLLDEYEKAIEDYDKAMAIDPKNAEYSHYKGLAHENAGRTEEAIESFQLVLEKDDTYLAAELHLGMMYRRSRKFEDALACLMDDRFEAVTDKRMLGQVYETRGLICGDMDSLEESLGYLDRAIEVVESARREEDPELKDALDGALGEYLFHRGVVRSKLKRYEEALADLHESLKLSPKDAAAVLNERGMCWKYLGNLPEAISDLSAAVEKSGGTVLQYLCNRAQCFLEFGLFTRADDDLSKAISIGGTESRGNCLYYRRGVARFVQQRFEESIKDLRKAVHLDPPPEASMADLYYHLGLCEANVGTRPQRALHAFTKAIKCLPSEGPPKPHYIHEMAKALQMCGEHEKALRNFSEVLRWQPLNARAMFRRAFSFKALKMFDEAAEDFEAARELEPNDMRFVVNYKKIADYEAVTLGPAGYEDQIPYRDAKASAVPSLDRGLAKYNELVAEVDDDDDDDDDL
ncbi:hypothetical protein FOZ61_008696 [Perkinsus olseni]|uniref:Uncharacterized protein n=1 Tax=Perkinsus olseni TaxID=32597 RepID=A0A7J6L3M7_PEROL|nr:hypothetical protein FOZ61_008696 [Perkinsus olseni]